MTAQRLKAAVAPDAFYRVEVPSMPRPRSNAGWTDGGLCPFHDDKHRGNFRVNLDSGAFRCFSCGAKGGDIISFAQLRHEAGFGQALRMLQEAWGVAP